MLPLVLWNKLLETITFFVECFYSVCLLHISAENKYFYFGICMFHPKGWMNFFGTNLGNFVCATGNLPFTTDEQVPWNFTDAPRNRTRADRWTRIARWCTVGSSGKQPGCISTSRLCDGYSRPAKCTNTKPFKILPCWVESNTDPLFNQLDAWATCATYALGMSFFD